MSLLGLTHVPLQQVNPGVQPAVQTEPPPAPLEPPPVPPEVPPVPLDAPPAPLELPLEPPSTAPSPDVAPPHAVSASVNPIKVRRDRMVHLPLLENGPRWSSRAPSTRSEGHNAVYRH
jgi:hypothetical protein